MAAATVSPVPKSGVNDMLQGDGRQVLRSMQLGFNSLEHSCVGQPTISLVPDSLD